MACVVALGVGLLIAAGCSADAGSDLEGATWVLGTFVGADGAPREVIDDTRIDLTFRGDQISGNAGCNSYSGSYELGGESVSFGSIAVTEMWCESPEGVMEQELDYLTMLADVDGFVVEGGTLTFSNASDTEVAVYRAEE